MDLHYSALRWIWLGETTMVRWCCACCCGPTPRKIPLLWERSATWQAGPSLNRRRRIDERAAAAAAAEGAGEEWVEVVDWLAVYIYYIVYIVL